jgi:hypothetical protein
MALVSGGWYGTASIADHGGNVSTLKYMFDPLTTADFAAALAAMASLVADLDSITDGEITGYNVTEFFYEDAIALPAAGIEIEDKASVTYSIVGNNKKGNFKIPTPVSAGANNLFGVVGGAANQVNTAQAALQAYADNFRTAGNFTISDGEKLNVILVGKRVSAKNNNG